MQIIIVTCSKSYWYPTNFVRRITRTAALLGFTLNAMFHTNAIFFKLQEFSALANKGHEVARF